MGVFDVPVKGKSILDASSGYGDVKKKKPLLREEETKLAKPAAVPTTTTTPSPISSKLAPSHGSTKGLAVGTHRTAPAQPGFWDKTKDVITGIAKDTGDYWSTSKAPVAQDVRGGVESVGQMLINRVVNPTRNYIMGAPAGPQMDPSRVAASPFSKAGDNVGSAFSGMNKAVPTPNVPTISTMGPTPPNGINLTPQSHTQNLGTMTVGGVTKQVNTNPLGDLTTVDPAGKMSRIKQAGFIRNADQPKAPGTSPLPGGVHQALGLPGGNYTGMMNAETAMLTAAANPGGGAGGAISSGRPGVPQQTGVQAGDQYFRSLEAERVDLLNRAKAFNSGNYSPSAYGTLTPMQRAKMVASDQGRLNEIDTALTGRSELANDIMKAILGANTAAAGSKDEITKQGIATQGVKYSADKDAAATVGASAYKTDAAAQAKQQQVMSDSITAELGILQKRMTETPNDASLQERFDKLSAELARLRAGQTSSISLDGL